MIEPFHRFLDLLSASLAATSAPLSSERKIPVDRGCVNSIPAMTLDKEEVLLRVYKEHPERFVRKGPVPQPLPEAVWINSPISRRLTRG